jgi:hypothetical protein
MRVSFPQGKKIGVFFFPEGKNLKGNKNENKKPERNVNGY